MNQPMKLFNVTLVLIGALLIGPVIADDQYQIREMQMSGEILSLEQVLENLPNQPEARVLEVDLERKNGRLVFEIERLEARGQVREYRLDARSGELLSVEDD